MEDLKQAIERGALAEWVHAHVTGPDVLAEWFEVLHALIPICPPMTDIQYSLAACGERLAYRIRFATNEGEKNVMFELTPDSPFRIFRVRFLYDTESVCETGGVVQ